MTPIAGGLIADRVLGQRRTVAVGAVLMAIGHFLMAFEALLLPALFTLILGNGAFKPNISTQVGELYAEGDARRDRAFSIFYLGINLGAMFSPLDMRNAWRKSRLALRVHRGRHRHADRARHLFARASRAAAGRVAKGEAAHAEHAPLTPADWRAIAALLVLFVPNTLFWAAYEQQGNTIALWIKDYTDRSINLLFAQAEIPASSFQSFNPAMILIFTPFVVAWWGWLARRGREPSTVTKMAIGCFLLALSYLALALVAAGTGEAAKANWLWLLVYFAILTVGELYLSPVGLSLVSKVAPASMLSLMMGVWLATSFLGNFMAGWLGSYWSSMDKPAFFLMIAGVAALAGFAIALMNKPLRKILQH